MVVRFSVAAFLRPEHNTIISCSRHVRSIPSSLFRRPSKCLARRLYEAKVGDMNCRIPSPSQISEMTSLRSSRRLTRFGCVYFDSVDRTAIDRAAAARVMAWPAPPKDSPKRKGSASLCWSLGCVAGWGSRNLIDHNSFQRQR